ncbi:PAS domain S-box protein [Pseudanabaena mucicola]|uniref:histidine kinase n=1 Tax=Pseudanabaena mucicola FACHB-723 TaxID=2692860 RepID=A0ABR8A2F4_9CYAN|nr:PAS domain S-box protein [Pseudanabaena mucicola]MBD2189736.1 PAS domain S-box protein [Pseudanabaena mucicola FACHB-723]
MGSIELERLVTERTASLLITAEREKIVANIADRIRVSLNLPDVLETCVTEVRDFLQCDRVIVYQFQEDWSGIIITESVATGFSSSLGNHIRDSCFQDHSTYIYRQDQPILVNNIYTAGYADCHVQLLEQYQVKANLVVPIRVSGQLWGLLIGHQCQSPRDWVVDDMRLLQNIAVQLAIAIQQANAYQQLQHELAEREKTERLFREAQRIAKLGNWTLDLQTNTLYWSDEVFRIMELDPRKFTASYETFLSMIHPEDRELVNQAYQKSLRDHLPYNVIHRLLLNDGQIKYVQEQCETFYDDNGSPICSQGTVQDITNLKQTELELAFLNNQLEERVQERTAQLLAQEEQLRDFFDNANDLIQSVRLADGSFEYVNQSWLKTLGYQQDDIKDLNIFDILHPNCQEHCRQLMAQMMINAASTLDQIELTLITKTKQIIIVEGNVNCRTELDSNHQLQPVATRAILRDITARKQIERELQESRDKFQRLVNDIGEKFIIFSHTGTTGILTYVSGGVKNLCGFEREDVINHNWKKVIDWDLEDLPKTEMYIQMMVDHLIDFHQFEMRLTHLNGSKRTINVSEHPVYDGEGKLIAVEGIVEDITERKLIQQQILETNRQLAMSNEQLARATRLKDEFLANMSHELRTPLNAILGITEGLQESVFGALNQQQQKVLQTIEKSGNHLLELINDILDLAKIEAGKLTLEFDTTAIEPLSQASIMFVRQQAIQKNVHLQVNIAPLLPNLTIDERRIRQVLINLLNNAVKFTPEGGKVSLNVTLEKAEPDLENITHWVKFTVLDTGIGIDHNNLKQLFQPFIQVDSALNRKFEGTGLGLALVKRIVELHGGKVLAHSVVGVGSSFAIALPYNEKVSPLPKKPLIVNPTALNCLSDDDTVPPPLILLAEDNEANMMTISSYLEAKGYRMIFAKNGEEVIALVRDEHPDLVLMDIQMPKIDGLEAIKQIRSDSQFANLPIIAITALAMTGDREKCLESGANEYLSKPIKLKQLALLVEKFVC